MRRMDNQAFDLHVYARNAIETLQCREHQKTGSRRTGKQANGQASKQASRQADKQANRADERNIVSDTSPRGNRQS